MRSNALYLKPTIRIISTKIYMHDACVFLCVCVFFCVCVYTYIFIGMRGELGWDGDEGEGPKRGEGPKGMLGLKGGGVGGRGKGEVEGDAADSKEKCDYGQQRFLLCS